MGIAGLERIVAGAKRLRFQLARRAEDPTHPVVLDWHADAFQFPDVVDHTGRFRRPEIATLPNFPVVDVFAVSEMARFFAERTPLFSDGKLVSPSRKRMTTRAIFAHGRFVIKVGPESVTELSLQSRLAPGDRQFFAPIVAYGRVEDDPFFRAWVAQPVMPLMQELHRYSLDQWREGWRTLWPVINRYHLGTIRPLEIRHDRARPRHWSLYKGRPVIYDFGGVSQMPECLSGTCKHRSNAPEPPVIFTA